MGWGSILAIALAAAFSAGYERGERLGLRTKEITEYVRVELPPAYAQACSDMMEAAWSLTDERPEADGPSPPIWDTPHD